MAGPPQHGRAQWVKKPQGQMRSGGRAPAIDRPDYESLADVVAEARGGVAAQIDRHPELRPTAYWTTNALGARAGVLRGGYHAAKGALEAAAFARRLADPLPDMLMGRPTAMEQTLDLGAEVGAYTARVARNPQIVGDDVRAAIEKAKADLVPGTTPSASNTSDELARRFAIGMNQGELAFDAASLAVGGPLAKTVGKAGEALALTPVTPAKYIGQGYTPGFSAYLAEPYRGMGSHWMPRRLKLPKFFRDSDFNVLKPPGIQRGEMYELHARVDPHFRGANPPKEFGGERWSFKNSGIKGYGPLGQLYYGAPGPTKARAGGIGTAAASAAYDDEGRGGQ